MADARKYYETLKLSYGASSQEVSRAYRALAIEVHPDKNPDDKEAGLKFGQLQEAYKALSDTENRRKLLNEKQKTTNNPKEYIVVLFNSFLTFKGEM